MDSIKIKIDIKLLFIIIVLLCFLEAIVYIFLVNCNENYFYIGTMKSDPGGDFYLSLLYSSKLKPYDNVFPYPPLTVLICFFLRFVSHDIITLNADIADFNNSFFNEYASSFEYKNLFFLLTIITFIIMFYLIYAFFKKYEKNELKLFFISIMLLFNSGLLCALVRGNLILQSLLFTLVFCMTYNSNRTLYRYLAIFSLVLSFNIKPYAAIFGVLYLYEKQYKDAIICAIIAFIVFIVPFCFLDGGFKVSLISFFKNLKSFGNSNYMFGINSFIITVFNKTSIINEFELTIKSICSYLSVLFNVILLLSGFRTSEQWKKILTVTLFMILLTSNYGYILSFLLIPIMFFVRDESLLTKNNIFVLFIFLFLTAPFIVTRYHLPTIRYILCNIFLIYLAFWVIVTNFISL